MNADFEKRLQDQPMREPPREWRAEILRAAARDERPPFVSLLASWLWPHPRAWAGRAAVWAVILLLDCTAPRGPRVARGSAAMPYPSLAIMRQQNLLMAQLLGPADAEAPAALPAPPKPRSDRLRPRGIG